MKAIFHDLGSYGKAVFIEGTQNIFTFFDVLGIIIFLLSPTKYAQLLVSETYVRLIGEGIFLLSFILANFHLYQKHEKIKQRLNDYEPDLTKIIVTKYNPFPPENRVGIIIKNLTHEDFYGVIEFTKLTHTIFENHYIEDEVPLSIKEENCHFSEVKIIGNDSQVIKLAELKDHGCVFLTEKPERIDIDPYFHALDKSGMMIQLDYIKIKFGIEFELRGKFKKETFKRKYISQIELISRKSQISGQETSIEQKDIKYMPPSIELAELDLEATILN